MPRSPKAMGAAAADGEGVQARTALFARWVLTFVALIFVFQTARTALFVPGFLPAVFVSPPFLFVVAMGVVCAGAWLLCRWRPLAPPLLVAVDALLLLLLCGCVAAMSFYAPRPLLLFATLLVVLLRAATIPSSTRRTALLSSAALLPLLAVALAKDLRTEGIDPRYLVTFMVEYVALVVVFAAVAAQVSRVIFNLRRSMAEARRLGQYVIEEEIGRGGMGVVFRARHVMLRRPTAIKLLGGDAPAALSARDQARFEREVQLASQLTHPNTVAIYDYGRTPDNVLYYAMEYLAGLDLQQLVDEEGPLEAARVALVMSQICGSLGEAHELGLIHRDVKPANVILCDEHGGIADVAKLIDFGLARRVEGLAGQQDPDDAAIIIGTPGYLAPEAIEAPASVTAATDVYGLGAVGFFLLTGRAPFVARSVDELIELQRVGDVPALAPTDAPPELTRAIEQCLARKAAERPDARSLARTLAAIAEIASSRADETPRPARPAAGDRRARHARGGATVGQRTVLISLAGRKVHR